MDSRTECVEMFRKIYNARYPKKTLDTKIWNLKQKMIAHGWDGKLVDSFAIQAIYGSRFGYDEMAAVAEEQPEGTKVPADAVVIGEPAAGVKPVVIEIKLPGPPPGKRGGTNS